LDELEEEVLKQTKQRKMRISQRILQAHCQSRTNPSTDQSFVKELAKPTQRKIVFKKFPTLQKNKKRNAQPDIQ